MSVNGDPILPVVPSVQIYTDGGCEPNPGLGGYGVVLLHPKEPPSQRRHSGISRGLLRVTR